MIDRYPDDQEPLPSEVDQEIEDLEDPQEALQKLMKLDPGWSFALFSGFFGCECISAAGSSMCIVKSLLEQKP